MKDSSAEIISLHVETRCETQANYKICLKSTGLREFLVGFVFCCLRHVTIEKNDLTLMVCLGMNYWVALPHEKSCSQDWSFI